MAQPMFFYTSVYDSVADADYEALRSLHKGGAIGSYDSAVIVHTPDGGEGPQDREADTEEGLDRPRGRCRRRRRNRVATLSIVLPAREAPAESSGYGARVRVLTVNAGSSSLKLRLVDDDDSLLASAELPAQTGRADEDALREALEGMHDADAIAHRVVHGGARFTGPVRIDPEIVEALRALTPLAPLHQPAALDAMAAVEAQLPDLPTVACIDTAFHSTLPPAARTYALPREWRERYDLRRFGFHGLSHAHAARRAADMLGEAPERLRVVSCHLGAGASLAAISGGRSVDTTMGFTPVDGLVMATRSGGVDPGMLLWLIQHGGLEVDEVSDALEHGAGLQGLAGTPDMRDVLEAARRGEADAALARDVYLHRLRALIAAMTASLGGLDALIFTGGVGERSSQVRSATAEGLAHLGVAVDPALDVAAVPDADVSAPRASVRTLVVAAREDLQMAREARAVLRR